MSDEDSMSNFPVMLALSEAIKSKRINLGISQQELALRAKLHRTYISDIEAGRRNLSLKSLVKLAEALELSVSDLVIFAEEKLEQLPVNKKSVLV